MLQYVENGKNASRAHLAPREVLSSCCFKGPLKISQPSAQNRAQQAHTKTQHEGTASS